MTNRNPNDRRQRQADEHGLVVRADGQHIKVQCKCGKTVTGRRDTDPYEISLSDLLGLVRVGHGNA